MEKLMVPLQLSCGARFGATPSPSEVTSPEAVSREHGNVPSGPSMSSSSSLRVEALNPPNELPAERTLLAEQLQDDFALVQLDTSFVTLLSEISALEPDQSDGRGWADVESAHSGETRRTRKIESVLARLEPVELAILATPARTIVGLGVKARHAAYVVSEHWDAPIEQIDWDGRAVRLLIEAICKAAGVRLPFPDKAGQ
ncbi:MAG: hypothetical protein WA418_35295 [Bradyrhizobium sp.]